MTAYILSVTGIVLISVLAGILIPSGRTGKFINTTLKLCCLFVIISPLASLGAGVAEGVFSGNGGTVELDESFLSHAIARRIEGEEKELQSLIFEKTGAEAAVKIAYREEGYAACDKKVTVKIINFGMLEKDEHILIITEIVDLASEVLKIEKTEVTVYE